MESLKKIETCSNCNSNYRIPTDKHIIVKCPKCGHHFEYRNGQKVEQKKRRRWIPILIFLVSLGLLGTWLFKSNSEKITFQNFFKVTSIDTSLVFSPISQDYIDTTLAIAPSYNSVYDTTEILINKLEDEITDTMFDILKDLIEKILDHIEKEAKNGNWERANEWFERTTYIMENGDINGKALFEIYETRLAKLKVEILSKDPNPNILPSSELTNDTRNEGGHATEYVTNATNYTLTLYYTGPTSTVITIAPGREKCISLRKGLYSIVAKVSAPSVRECYGTRYYKGLRHVVKYYITTSLY